MFLITKLNNQVIIGPRATWHQKLIQAAVDEEFEDDGIHIQVPAGPPASGTILSEIKFYNVQDIGIIGDYNPKIQNTNGPFFNFPDGPGLVEQYWVPVDKQVDMVKYELAQEIAENRWKMETSGIKVTLQGQEVTVDTNRGSRDIFAQALLLGSTGATWKFPEGWLTLSNAELGVIVTAIMTHIQTCFAWEGTKLSDNIAKNTLVELDAVEVLHPSQVVAEPVKLDVI